MKTFISSTVTQFILFVLAARMYYLLYEGLEDYQVSFFLYSLYFLILPFGIYNLIGQGIVFLALKKAKPDRPVLMVILLLFLYSFVVSVILVSLYRINGGDIIMNAYSISEYFGIHVGVCVLMSIILSAYYIVFNKNILKPKR